MSLLDERRTYTDEKLAVLRDYLDSVDIAGLLGASACIYATGSVARGESAPRSDLDVFILAENESALTRLNSILIKADLIRAARKAGFPDFSGDGQWLDVYYVDKMIENIGAREDDWKNTLTARVLMIVEGYAIRGEQYFRAALTKIIKAYWRDYAAFSHKFAPFFLLNDITKYWKILCLEYAHRNAAAASEEATLADKIARRLSRYKLHHSRLLICFSVIIAIGYEWRRSRQTLDQSAMLKICSMRPLERLTQIALRERADPFLPVGVSSLIADIVARYENFLLETGEPKLVMSDRLADEHYATNVIKRSLEFRTRMYTLVREVLGDTQIFQYVVM